MIFMCDRCLTVRLLATAGRTEASIAAFAGEFLETDRTDRWRSLRQESFSAAGVRSTLFGRASLKFRLRARYPIRAHTFEARVYEYYDPDVSSVAPPLALEVVGKR